MTIEGTTRQEISASNNLTEQSEMLTKKLALKVLSQVKHAHVMNFFVDFKPVVLRAYTISIWYIELSEKIKAYT